MRVQSCPLASAWDPVWVWHNHMGPINLWFAELLAEEMQLEPGMRVLDMGCGTAATSLFLAMEYGVEVWAADLWVDPTDNFARIEEAGLEQQVHPAVDVDLADQIPGGRGLWIRFLEANAAWTGEGDTRDQPDGELLFSPHGVNLGFTRLVATKRSSAL